MERGYNPEKETQIIKEDRQKVGEAEKKRLGGFLGEEIAVFEGVFDDLVEDEMISQEELSQLREGIVATAREIQKEYLRGDRSKAAEKGRATSDELVEEFGNWVSQEIKRGNFNLGLSSEILERHEDLLAQADTEAREEWLEAQEIEVEEETAGEEKEARTKAWIQGLREFGKSNFGEDYQKIVAEAGLLDKAGFWLMEGEEGLPEIQKPPGERGRGRAPIVSSESASVAEYVKAYMDEFEKVERRSGESKEEYKERVRQAKTPTEEDYRRALKEPRDDRKSLMVRRMFGFAEWYNQKMVEGGQWEAEPKEEKKEYMLVGGEEGFYEIDGENLRGGGGMALETSRSTRENNQDSAAMAEYVNAAGEIRRIMLVADGMGGLAGGEVASRIVTEEVMKAVRGAVDPAEGVRRGIAAADREIKRWIVEASQKAGKELRAGSTLVVAECGLDGAGAFYHLGDSKGLVVSSEGKIKSMTKDHSFVQDLIDSGRIKEEERYGHRRSNLVTRSVGDIKEMEKVEMTDFLLEPGDEVLCYSDGISDSMSPEMVADLVSLERRGRGGSAEVTRVLAANVREKMELKKQYGEQAELGEREEDFLTGIWGKEKDPKTGEEINYRVLVSPHLDNISVTAMDFDEFEGLEVEEIEAEEITEVNG